MTEARLIWRGAQAVAAERAGAAKGTHEAGEHLLTESRRIVPIDTATLERSGRVTTNPDKPETFVSYNTPYAVDQHEDLSYNHAPGRQAKYLEEPLREQAAVLQQIIAARIKEALE